MEIYSKKRKGFTVEKMFLIVILIIICYFLIRLIVLNFHIGLNFPKNFHLWPKNVQFDNINTVFPKPSGASPTSS